MASNIDPSKPNAGEALTQDVRDNFANAKTEIEALQADTTSALTNAAAASTAAAAAMTAANEADDTADAAQATANTAITNAATALAAANEADDTADAAQATANTAVTNAATAQSAANSAQTTANTAVTNAATALTAANEADDTADAAQATANTAITNAATALTAANEADDTADAAQATANAAGTAAAAAAALIGTTTSFTPTLTGGGSGAGYTYASRICHYKKIGDLVHISGIINLSARPLDSTNIRIEGLPFNIKNVTGYRPLFIVVIISGNAGAAYAQYGIGTENSSGIYIAYTVNGAQALLLNTDIENATAIAFSGSYLA